MLGLMVCGSRHVKSVASASTAVGVRQLHGGHNNHSVYRVTAQWFSVNTYFTCLVFGYGHTLWLV